MSTKETPRSRKLVSRLKQTVCVAFACFAISGTASAQQVSLTDNLVAKLKSKSSAINSKLSPGAGYNLDTNSIKFSGNFESSPITFQNRAKSAMPFSGTTAWGAACTPGDYTITGSVEVELEDGETFESSQSTSENVTVTVNASAGNAFASASMTAVTDLNTSQSTKSTKVKNIKAISSSSNGLNRRVTCADGQPQFFQMIGSASQINWYNGAYSPPDFSKPIPYTYDLYPAAGSKFTATFIKPGSTQPGQNLAVHFYDGNRKWLWTLNYGPSCSSAQNCDYYQAWSGNTPDFFGSSLRKSARYVNVSTGAGKDRVDVLICETVTCYSADDQGTDVLNPIPSNYTNNNLVSMKVRNYSNTVVNEVKTSVTGTVSDFVSVAEATTQISGQYTAATMDELQTAYSFTQMSYQDAPDAAKSLCTNAEAAWASACSGPKINAAKTIVLSPK